MATQRCQKDLEEKIKELEREIQLLRGRVEELQDSAAFFKEVVDSSRDVIYRRSYKDGLYEYFNAATASVTGYTPEQIQELGGDKFILSVVHPDDQDHCRTALESAVISEKRVADVTVQYRLRRKDGDYVWLDEKLTVVKDGSGKPDFFVGNARDISAEKQAVEALQESESRFAAFMNHIPACVFIKDHGSTPLYANTYLLENMVGGSVEGEKESRRDAMYEALAPRFLEQDKNVLKEGLLEIIETLPDQNGRERIFRTLKFPIQREGKPALLGGVAIDITEQTKAEKGLKESEKKYRTLFQACRETIIITGPATEIIDINQAGVDLLGYTRGEIIGRSYQSFVADLPREEAFFQQMSEQGYVKDFEDRLQTKNGMIIDCLVSVNPMIADDGFLYGYQGIVHDITAMKEAIQALQVSEVKFRTMFEKSPIGIELFDSEGFFLEANQACMEIFGVTKTREAKRFNLLQYDGIPDEIRAKTAGGESSRYVAECRFNTLEERDRHRGDHGKTIFLDILTTPLGKQDESLPMSYLVHMQDITARKRAEEALQDRERLYRMLAENVTDVIATLDMNLTPTYVSPSVEELIGYTAEAAAALQIRDIMTPASYQAALKIFKKELESEVLGTSLQPRGRTSEFEIVCRDGSLIWTEVKATFLHDETGNPAAILAVVRDVTERKHAEEKIYSLTKQLLHAQEQERKRIAMDLHDNLAQELSALAIRCYTEFNEFCSELPELGERVAGFSGSLKEAVESVRQLAYDLRPPTLELFGIGQAVKEYCDEFSSKYGILIRFSSAGIDELKLDANTGINIYRIVQEALSNVRNHAHAAQVIVKMFASHPRIILRIEDDGQGFDMVGRSKEAVREKRMGLINIEERVKLLQGTFQLQTSPSKGTHLYLGIPYHKEKTGV